MYHRNKLLVSTYQFIFLGCTISYLRETMIMKWEGLMSCVIQLKGRNKTWNDSQLPFFKTTAVTNDLNGCETWTTTTREAETSSDRN
jgi:hypothetical protein